MNISFKGPSVIHQVSRNPQVSPVHGIHFKFNEMVDVHKASQTVHSANYESDTDRN